MAAINDKTPKTFAIIDNFKVKKVDLDTDEIPDVSHGEVVEKMLLTQQPDAKIIRYDVTDKKDSDSQDIKKVYEALDDVAKKIDSGEKIDGVNLSAANENDFKGINEWLDKKVTKDNISENEGELRDIYNMVLGKKNPVTGIEKVTSRGTPVYIPAGNGRAENYNMTGVAKGVTQVGATNDKGEKEEYSGDNSDVKTWAQGTYRVTNMAKKGKIYGYDYTGDGKMDFPADKASTKGNIRKMKTFYHEIKGTSFASPTALGRDTAN